MSVPSKLLVLLLFCLLANHGVTYEVQPASPSPAPPASTSSPGASKPAEHADIYDLVTRYEAAFNAHSPERLGEMWMPEALFNDRITNTKIQGRANLIAAYQSLFQEHPHVRVQLELTDIQPVREDIVSAEGVITVFKPDEEPERNIFTSLYVKTEGVWKIASAEEITQAAPPTPYESLQPLAWLVGSWSTQMEAGQASARGQAQAVEVTSRFRFSASKSFLLRSFAMHSQEDGQTILEGTQIIGWDPRAQQIRSWTFNSDGSFGEGFWSKSGDDWLIKSAQTLADGSAASGTYVLSRSGDDQIQVTLVGHMIDGAPQPQSEPVLMTRVPEPPAQAETESAPPAQGSAQP